MLGDCSPPLTPYGVWSLPGWAACCPAGGREGPVGQAGMVRSSDPAGGQGRWRSGRGRFGEKGQAPPFGADHLCPPSLGGQPGGPGGLARCRRPSTPKLGTGMSRAGCRDLASTSGSLGGWGWERERAYLLQKAGRWEGSDNGISHRRADPVELPDLPPPGTPKPCAISCHSLACHPVPGCAEGKGLGLLELPEEGEGTGKFLEASSPLATQAPSGHPSKCSCHPPGISYQLG